MEELVFIHLSDIHFKKFRNGVVIGTDDDIRNEILLDVEREIERFNVIRGVLITGDIAFSGQPGQY